MALQVSQAPVAALPYKLYDGHSPGFPGTFYNQYLITAPRQYQESISAVNFFFYEPGNDYLVGYVFLDILDWPGWAAQALVWDAGSGALLNRFGVPIPYTANPGLGSYNKIYGMRGFALSEVDWQTLGPPAGGWSIDPHGWNPSVILTQAIVNREDGVLAGTPSGRNLVIYSISGTPTLKGQLVVPDFVDYLAYEDRFSCWVVTQSGFIAKARYNLVPPRWEMFSSVQNPAGDSTGYLCAFDTKRKRLVILRKRPDAADGSCQSQLEFYAPIYQAAALTDPIPATPLRAGLDVTFLVHLLGTAGEGIASRILAASLAGPATGRIKTPAPPVNQLGVGAVTYYAAAAGNDTLQLSVEDTTS
jgi:hypothetical protein